MGSDGRTGDAPARVARHVDVSGPSAADVLMSSAALDLSGKSAWAVLPEVAMRLVAPGEVLAGRSSPMSGRVRNLGRALMRGRGPNLIRVGPVLFLSTSVQTDRVLRPVLDELARTSGPAQSFHLPSLNPVAALAAQRAARRAHRELRRWLRASGLAEPDGLEEELTKAESLLRQASAAAFSDAGIRALVVASQHNCPTRALLAAASAPPDGPTTVYLPHAPVADNPFYRDLPVHYALLRGPSEVDFYRGCGVEDGDRVRVVGQPGFPRPTDQLVRDAEHVVYAATGYSDDVLRADIEVIKRSVDHPVEVCLHPRMSEQRGDLFPAEWTIHPPGATLEGASLAGALALIQHGSGVGLEAMGVGVDVIDLCPVGERPNYPYLAAPYVQLASDEVGLRRAMGAIPARRSSREDRVRFGDELVLWVDSKRRPPPAMRYGPSNKGSGSPATSPSRWMETPSRGW